MYRIAVLVFISLTLVAVSAVLFYAWFLKSMVRDTVADQAESVAVARTKPEPRIVKGLYLTAHSAGTEKKMNEIIALIEATELNAVVIDIKDYSGQVRYDSSQPLVEEIKAESNQLGDAGALIQRLHERDIYVIARQTVFQDPILARAKPDWAIKSSGGGLPAGKAGVWRDYKGLAWVDPGRRGVWEYNLAIAKEAIALGFDEINFDYVRFPSDGNLKTALYSTGQKKEYEVMREFFGFMSTALSSQPAWLSVDLFGFVLERSGENDLQVGQRLDDALDNFDYISPMMYPSHYPAGHLGLGNPAARPELVIENGLKKGVPRFEGKRAKLRPWLQAFNLGATYDAAKIRAEIDMVEKYPNAGWLLWNASNRYTNAGLKEERTE